MRHLVVTAQKYHEGYLVYRQDRVPNVARRPYRLIRWLDQNSALVEWSDREAVRRGSA